MEFLILGLLAIVGAGILARRAEAAPTSYPTTGKNAVMTWSDLTEYQNYEHNFWHANGFGQNVTAGDFDPFKAERSPVSNVTDLAKGDKGDHIRFPWLGKLTQTPKYGDNTMEGNEEGIKQGDLDVYVDQVRAAAGFVGRVSAIRAKNLRTATINKLLSEFAVDWLENDMFYTFTHGASAHLVSLSVYTATAHPNTYYGTQSTTDPTVLGESDNMSTDILDFVIRRWQGNSSTQTLRFAQAGKVNSSIIAVMTPQQLASLCNDAKFWDMHKDALARAQDGDKDMHPLFANANFKYRNIWIYENSRCHIGTDIASSIAPDGLDATHHCAMFLGSDAIRCAHAGVPTDALPDESGMSYDADGNVKFLINTSFLSDYGNKNKRALAMVYGFHRSDFTKRTPPAETVDAGTFNNSSLSMWTKETADSF